jgi:Zinc-binding dehydrogenase
MAAVTALLAVRDDGRVQAGRRVLVNGASGGVGTFAVQLARAYGGEVTGVCGPRNVDLVRSLGAAEVIDYSTADFTRADRRYDALVDIAGTRPLSACRRVLEPRGTLVAVGGPAGRWLQPAGHVFAALARGPFVSQRVVVTDARRATGQDLLSRSPNSSRAARSPPSSTAGTPSPTSGRPRVPGTGPRRRQGGRQRVVRPVSTRSSLAASTARRSNGGSGTASHRRSVST